VHVNNIRTHLAEIQYGSLKNFHSQFYQSTRFWQWLRVEQSTAGDGIVGMICGFCGFKFDEEKA
jgi:hypothetical protein